HTTHTRTLSLHDALPICQRAGNFHSTVGIPLERSVFEIDESRRCQRTSSGTSGSLALCQGAHESQTSRTGISLQYRLHLPGNGRSEEHTSELSHQIISYA